MIATKTRIHSSYKCKPAFKNSNLCDVCAVCALCIVQLCMSLLASCFFFVFCCKSFYMITRHFFVSRDSMRITVNTNACRLKLCVPQQFTATAQAGVAWFTINQRIIPLFLVLCISFHLSILYLSSVCECDCVAPVLLIFILNAAVWELCICVLLMRISSCEAINAKKAILFN